MTELLCQPGSGDEHVNELDPDERNNDSAGAVDQKIVAQQRGRAHGAICHAAQRQRDQRNDDDRVEDHRREHSRLRRPQVHDVQRVQHRERRRQTWPE